MIKHVIQAKKGVRMSTKVHVPDPQPDQPAEPAEETKKNKPNKQGRRANAQVAENESQEDE